MKYIFLYLFLLITVFASGQITFDKTSHNFGDIEANEPRYVDIHLKNKTSEDAFILSVDNPREVVFIQKSAFIAPDSSSVLRFQINKKTTGRFLYTIPVFTSDREKATEIQLKGKINSLPVKNNSFTACPTFGQQPSQGNPLEFTLTVRTIDKETKEKLSNSTVAILQNGTAIGKFKTRSNGQFKEKIPLGISYFYATHSGYLPAEKGAYINFKNNLIILELTPKKEPEIEDPIVEEIEEEVEPEDTTEIIIEAEPQEKETTAGLVVDVDTLMKPEETPSKFSELDKDNFDAAYFKPINIVFVIDVSYSMRHLDRLQLLKTSLSRLVEMLRPEDKIGLVSYATKTSVLLKPTTGDNKEEINKIVSEIKASGRTAGGAGIKLGFRQARRNRIKEGKNHVIVITDGAFNQDSGNYRRYIKRNLRWWSISFSVVGIKSKERSENNMREAAQLGEGRFLKIEKLKDAKSNLKQEIRKAAFRY